IYFRSAAPWVTVIVGFAVLGPHLMWIYQHDFISVQYAIARHAEHSVNSGLGDVFLYFADMIGYGSVPGLLLFVLMRPSRATISQMIWPSDREIRLVGAAFWGALLLPVVGTLAVGVAPTALWSMPAWTLLPVLMLSPQAVKVETSKLQVMSGLVVVELLVILIASPTIALAIHRI